MFVLCVTLTVFVGLFILFRALDGRIELQNVLFSILIAAMSAILALLMSLLIGGLLSGDQDNCDIEYSEYKIVKSDNTATEYVVIDNDKNGAEYTFTYINDSGDLDVAHLSNRIKVVYEKDVEPKYIIKHSDLKGQYDFWFINWKTDEYTIILPSHDSIIVN